MHDLTCVEVVDSAPGFALDILEPRTRARVAAHLIRCPECRQAVTEMEESAAQLLDLDGSPEWEAEGHWNESEELPPVRPARRRLRMVVTMAAAAALFVGSTFGPELAAHRSERPIASGVLIAGDKTVGTVRFFAGGMPMVEVEADHLPASGRLGVVLTYSDGSARRVGYIQVRDGHAVWAATEPAHGGGISSVVLVDPTLHQVAAASVH